ncbi:MAG TPA: hypothetical protein VF469_09840 [Kofleriaceae bacterium]
MSNAGQQVAIMAGRDQESGATVEDTIWLPSNGRPVSVGVSYDGTHIIFSFGGQSGKSLSWKAGGYALIIHFTLGNQPKIDELSAVTPSCWFANKTTDEAGTRHQTCCVPPVPGQYHIGADVTDVVTGTTTHIVDPVIVVTPIVTA